MTLSLLIEYFLAGPVEHGIAFEKCLELLVNFQLLFYLGFEWLFHIVGIVSNRDIVEIIGGFGALSINLRPCPRRRAARRHLSLFYCELGLGVREVEIRGRWRQVLANRLRVGARITSSEIVDILKRPFIDKVHLCFRRCSPTLERHLGSVRGMQGVQEALLRREVVAIFALMARVLAQLLIAIGQFLIAIDVQIDDGGWRKCDLLRGVGDDDLGRLVLSHEPDLIRIRLIIHRLEYGGVTLKISGVHLLIILLVVTNILTSLI